MALPSHLLVVGGARSGKSRFAEKEAAASGLDKVYLATAVAFDDEMRRRIARHREDRAGAGWMTVEEPIDLCAALGRTASPGRIVLVDCLTLWLSNLVLGKHDDEALAAEFVGALSTLPGPVILVSNEVGWGIVPEKALARAFRDKQGLLNQAVAEVCRRVVLVAAGLPLVLKHEAVARAEDDGRS